ncbi:hypothetical protein [Paenibacillus sp. y28]|uniref:hypothetical protein n=1 Tax=Paenibacillus sp. y28 TaxID=3129110 RepID=UPI00301727B6
MKWPLRSAEGSVSAYFIIILLAVFMFQAVLIDFVRIKLAERESETAAKAALRSTMSAFNPKLKEYGLFGLTADQAKQQQIFGRVLGLNMPPAAAGAAGSFSVLDTRQEGDARLTPLYHLGSHTVLERQILEEMKYVAPIEFTRELMDKWGKLKAKLEAGKNFAESADRLDDWNEQREEQLDLAWSILLALQKKGKSLQSSYDSAVERLDKLEEKIEDLEHDANVEAEQVDKARDKYNDYLDDTADSAQQDKQDMQTELDKLDAALRLAAIADERVRNELSAAGAAGSSPEPGELDPYETLKELPVYGQSYFDDYKKEAVAAVQLFDPFLRDLPRHSRKASASLKEKLNRFADALTAAVNARQAAEQQRQASTENRRKAQNEAKKIAKDKQEEAKKKAGAVCGSADPASYAKLEGAGGSFSKYVTANNGQLPAASPTVPDLNTSPDRSLTPQLTGLLTITDMLASLRNELFVNEYALLQFNYRTYDLVHAADKKLSLSEPSQHVLKGQETEYLIYGLPDCQLNLGAAYSELFLVRMAVRTVEALFDPKNKAAGALGPQALVLAALAQGAGLAVVDVEQLIGGGDVELTAKLAQLKLDYRDYLRLFLLLHTRDRHLYARMQALIELNTGADLMTAYTYMRAETQTSVRLWYVPAAMKLLSISGVLKGRTSDGRFVMEQKQEWTY